MKGSSFPCVDIGVPVYNEEDTILYVLKSLARQKGIHIHETIVVNDGSTDKTLERILMLNDSIKRRLNLKIINLNRNLGKANALNIIFKKATEEYLVLLDADMILLDDNTLIKLIEPMLEDPQVCLVCGWYETFIRSPFDIIGRAYRYSTYLLEDIASKMNNIFGATGAIMTLKRECYKALTIPNNERRDDAYIYLFVRYNMKKKFIFNPKAKAIGIRFDFNSRGLINDQIKSSNISKRLIEEFGDIVLREQQEPLNIVAGSVLRAFIKEPLGFFPWIIHKLIAILINKLGK